MQQQGRLTEWNDERGFGFITPLAGGPRVFAHISAFPHDERRPLVNDQLLYSEARDEQGRLHAENVRYVAATHSENISDVPAAHSEIAAPHGIPPAALAIPAAFFLLLIILLALGRIRLLLIVAYAVLSVILFAMYGADKAAAQQGRWRTPEATLHAVAIVGGWPGALLAQPVFRHKTRKQPFRTIFWLTVVANCAALAWLVFGTNMVLG